MYQVLYRKYRPKNFDDVVGQKIVVKTLENAIRNNKISHSYIFYGPRGTGKTTLAKIMARAVNCKHQDGKLLCDSCKNCIVSKENECVDIIEIDAASNNGVDEIRELKSKVNLVPSSLDYKIYIIDEVHMLSMGAFNALLKTIEEPPAHSIFILATTEIDKVPETIISRCQTFSFERVSNNDIVKRLRYVSDLENINISDEVLYEIARVSEGGMRDSLGMLDKVSIYKTAEITLEDFYKLNSLLAEKEIKDFIKDFCLGNNKELIKKINDYFNSGKNIVQISNQLVYKLSDVIVDYYINNVKEDFFDIKLIEVLANTLNEKMFDLKKSEHPNIYFEIMILNILRKLSPKSIDYEDKKNIVIVENKNSGFDSKIVEKEIDDNNAEDENFVEKKKSNRVVNKEEINEENLKLLYDINDVRINNTFAEASKDALNNHKSMFSKFSDFTFDTKIGYLICDIMDATLRAASERNIILSYEYDSSVKKNLKNIDKIQKVYNQITGFNVSIALITDENWEKIKEEYIKNKKNGIIYEYKEEPSLDDNSEKVVDDGNSESVIEMFGDVIEYE